MNFHTRVVNAVNCSFWSAGYNSIQLEDASRCSLKNVLCINGGNAGLEVLGGAQCVVDGCVISGNKYCGISLAPDAENDSIVPSLTLSNSALFDNGFVGLEVMTNKANLKVDNCRLAKKRENLCFYFALLIIKKILSQFDWRGLSCVRPLDDVCPFV